MNALLYSSTVLIWGTTWLAIYYQLGEIPVAVSVFYRFALAAVVMLLMMKLWGKLQTVTRRDHGFMVLQGGCLFSLNFLCFYKATEYIPSGLVSVVFSLAILFNALNSRWFWGEAITARVLSAAIVGVAGLLFLFAPQWGGGFSSDALPGLGLAALGTYFFSLGNMISRRHGEQGLSPLTTNSYAMAYGTAILALILLFQGQPLLMPVGARYYAALFYLSIFGSVIGFTTYLLLVNRIGANQAAYATVMFPVIALILSSWFENYEWTWTSFVGLGLALAGNLIMQPGLWTLTRRHLLQRA